MAVAQSNCRVQADQSRARRLTLRAGSRRFKSVTGIGASGQMNVGSVQQLAHVVSGQENQFAWRCVQHPHFEGQLADDLFIDCKAEGSSQNSPVGIH